MPACHWHQALNYSLFSRHKLTYHITPHMYNTSFHYTVFRAYVKQFDNDKLYESVPCLEF